MNNLYLPREATLYMTKVCNFYCEGCSRQTVGVKTFDDFRIEIVEKALEQYPSLNGFCLAGLGEPTLNKNFISIVNYLKENGKFVGVITNGSNIRPFQKLNCPPDYISVSLYGYNKEQYNDYVKLDIYDKVIENFKELKKLNTSVGLSYFVSRDNIKNLKEVISLAENIGADFLNITNYLVYNTSDKKELSKIIYTEDIDLINEIEQILSTTNIINARPIYLDKDNFSFYCASYRNIINIDGNGNIGGCQRQFQPSKEYGNIFTDKDPYNNGQMKKFQLMIKDSLYPHGDNCKYCFGKMNPSFNHKVDIGIYILFHEKVIQTIECIKSFLPFYIPIYVLNNGSSPQSIKELKSFTENYKNIEILHSDKNLGVGVGRNYLIENTNTQWMFFVDNDITIDTYNFIEIVNQNIIEFPEIDVFIPTLYNVHDDSYVHHLTMKIDINKVDMSVTDDIFTNVFPGGASIVNRKIFEQHGLYDNQMFVGLEDFELSLRALLGNNPIKSKFVKEINLIHDHREASTIEDKKAILERYNFTKLEASYLRIIEKYPTILFEHEFRPWVLEQVNKMLGGNVNLSYLSKNNNFGAEYNINNNLLCDNTELIQMFDIKALPYDFNESIVLSSSLCGINVDFGDGNYEQYTNDLFENYHFLETLFSREDVTNSKNIVVNVVLEYLEDPRPLIHFLRKYNHQDKDKRVFLISKLYQPNEYFHSVYRLWSSASIKTFLVSSGFIVEQIRELKDYELLVLKSDLETFDIFLQSNYLPKNFSYMIVSQEHAKAQLTGGIGSYVEEMERLTDEQIIIMLVPPFESMSPSKHYSMQKRHLNIGYFFDMDSVKYSSLDLITKDMIEIAIFLYDKLVTIELQDVNGKGFLALQAYNCGLYRSNLEFVTLCHASRLALEKLYQKHLLYNDRELYEEKYVIENSSKIIFPTKYLKNFYIHNGYELSNTSSSICRLPFTFSQTQQLDEEFMQIDTLIFFGKRIHYKGFDVFKGLIEELIKQNLIGNVIKKIVLIGPKFEEMVQENSFFDNLQIEVEELSLKREEALNTIKTYRNRAICYTPYVGDNHPNSVLEIIDVGCLLLASNKGGIPELIPNEYHSKILFELNSISLLEKTLTWLKIKPSERLSFVHKLFQNMLDSQIIINKNNLNRIQVNSSKKENNRGFNSEAYLIITYCKNQSEADSFLAMVLNQNTQDEKIIILSPVEIILDNTFNTKNIDIKSDLCNISALISEHKDRKYCIFMSSEAIYLNTFITKLMNAIQYSDKDFVTCNVVNNAKNTKFLGDGIINIIDNNSVGLPFGIYKMDSLEKLKDIDLESIFVNYSILSKMISEDFQIGIFPDSLYIYNKSLLPNDYQGYRDFIQPIKHLQYFDILRAFGYVNLLKNLYTDSETLSIQLNESKKDSETLSMQLASITTSRGYRMIQKFKKTKLHKVYMVLKKLKGRL